MPIGGLQVDPELLARLPESQRVQVLEELRLVEAAYKANPLLGYVPHRRQVEFHSPPFPPLRAFFGGNRSGKTTAVVADSVLQAVDQEFVPEHLESFKRWQPPFFCRFVTPDLGNTLEGVVLQKLRELCPPAQLEGGSFGRAWDKVLRVLKFKNGSWFQFFSNDQDLDKFGGAALHRVVFDEEPRGDIRRECLMRLIDYGGEELFAMTPLSGMSWIFDEVWEPFEKGELHPVDGRVVVVDMDDNPHLNGEAKRRVLAGLSSEEREARKSGRFVHFAGLVYPEFTGAHKIPSGEIPEGVEVFAAIDPGVRHMAAVLFGYLDFEGKLVVYDEIALQGATVKEVCHEILKRNERWKRTPRWYVIDPSARNKNHQTGRSDQQEYADNGVFTIPGQNSVSAGINRVKERLQAEGGFAVMSHCTELRAEFRRYRWASNSRTEDEAREKPVKKDDHLIDCLRYMCMQRPLLPERARREMSMTYKDRLLRSSLERLSKLGTPMDHPSGPGVFMAASLL